MSEKTVFLVYGYDNYEYPCRPIKSFASEKDARTFLAGIIEYQEKRPDYPYGDCSDDAFEKWSKRETRWRKRHPAGDAYQHDGFDVMPLPFSGATHDHP